MISLLLLPNMAPHGCAHHTQSLLQQAFVPQPFTCNPHSKRHHPFVQGWLLQGHFYCKQCAKKQTAEVDCIAARELTCKASVPSVVLTREKGKNGKVAQLLDERHISWVELPLVETIDGPDRSVYCCLNTPYLL